ncbi:MAG: DUF6441 family protein [Pseudomonadota bacterium]|jgi:hypothetical protein
MLNVTADVAKAVGRLSELARKHVPNAVAKALTRTAYDARDAVRQQMPHRFTIRRPWVVQGIGAVAASPRRLVAVVFSRDRFMALQETGGVKTGKIAIPVGRLASIARTQVIPKHLWPKALKGKPGVFVRNTMVLERKGRKVEPLWLLRRRQSVAPRLGMRETVRSVVLREYRRQMDQALREELAKD